MLEHLLSKQLIINMGKGGVGKSAISAMIARVAASQGKRVLVCEVNAKERMSQLLGGTPPEQDDSLEQIWTINERISAVNIQPAPAMKEYIVQVLHMRLLYNLVFENRVMRYFLRAVPGLQELIFIGKVWFHVEEDKYKGSPRFDLVILDAPATGHGLALLRIAKVVMDTVPAGPMRQAAEKIQKMLQDPKRTCINLVSLPEEMPTNETVELYHKLRDELKMPMGSLFLNQWPRHPLDPESPMHPMSKSGIEEAFDTLRVEAKQDPLLWPMALAADGGLHRLNKAREYLLELLKEVGLPTYTLPRFSQDDEHDLTQLTASLAKSWSQSKPLLASDIKDFERGEKSA
ncbi:MAG: ArsA family ATPase [Myxococcales bacterium]|nr:ArsA family ATPase [Myxococcales bacterium]